MLVFGAKVRYQTVSRGVFHCERCGGDRDYLHRAGRRWFHLAGVALLPGGGERREHLRCAVCGTCYRVELLAVPTVEQMRTALLEATTTAVLAMLRAGDWSSAAAQHRAIDLIRAAGSASDGEPSLVVVSPAARAGLADHPAGQDFIPSARLCRAMELFAVQLEERAKEWFLAKIVRVGLADGALSLPERHVAQAIAQHLGMTQARAEDVIWRVEQASP